jgi:cytidyltransferase-like protein
MKTVVIIPGGFHPFHAGHLSLYQAAKKAFPGADVYVAATDDQSTRPFPFAVKERLAYLAGVEPGHFVKVKSPFRADEITQGLDPDQDRVIFVRSEKDRNEPPRPGGNKKDGTPAKLQPLNDRPEPFGQHMYMAYLPTVEFGPGITSASEIRQAWPTLNASRKMAMIMSLYPATQKRKDLAQNVVDIFDQIIVPALDESADYIEEKWSQKYKRSINCANPRGFSQRAHCAGRKK